MAQSINIDTLTSPQIIDLMVELRLQFVELEDKINTLKPAFFNACAEYDSLSINHEKALISRQLTSGQWNYPDYILEQEKQLKRLKQDFRQKHEPISGRAVYWTIKLLTD